ncbi:MAG: phage antirepressor KilAC domain-containing protein [Fretibacterium sp.]|nr:phage antirepressor KilAC domain-containing protein [Fretibacterium sp.]
MADGEPWFVAKDVATTLGYSEASMSNMGQLLGAVPDEWKGRKRITTPGGEQEMLCLSEQGLYFFLGRSDKPAALPYQKTVAGQIMPSIRKHGAYMTPKKLEEILFNPDLLIGLAQRLKDEQAKSAALEARAEADRPKVLFADSVAASDTSILIGNLAKLIRQNGVDIGQNRLFQWMRKNGYLISVKGDRYNMPTQESMDRGLFEIVERTRISPNGNVHIDRTTKVTGKGQVFFVNQFLGGKLASSQDAA